jgi:hypothetical protein
MQGDQSVGELRTWQDLRNYLNNAGASHSAVVGGRMAWREFNKARLRLK